MAFHYFCFVSHTISTTILSQKSMDSLFVQLSVAMLCSGLLQPAQESNPCAVLSRLDCCCSVRVALSENKNNFQLKLYDFPEVMHFSQWKMRSILKIGMVCLGPDPGLNAFFFFFYFFYLLRPTFSKEKCLIILHTLGTHTVKVSKSQGMYHLIAQTDEKQRVDSRRE